MERIQLPEQDGHVVSYSVYGNPKGPTIISFHGGPGSKSKPHHAERYDLKKYRVILFDQRGCGKSTPLGELSNNTTEHTLNDAERIRKELSIESWFVSGGSWGSTLSLLYAINYPDQTKGLLLSGIWLADGDAKRWEYSEDGVAKLMPDVWEKRMQFLKDLNISLETQNKELHQAFKKADAKTQKLIALGISNWESNLFSSQTPISFSTLEDIDEDDIAAAKIYVCYEANLEFIPDNYILNNISKITHIPTVIVHGRYDILCPLDKAKQVADRIDNCELVIATSSGHKLTPEGETIQYMAYDRFLADKTLYKNY